MEAKTKVKEWLEELPDEFNSNEESAYMSASDSILQEEDAEQSKAVQEWDPMGYDYAAPPTSKPFYAGDFDEDLINKNEQRLCRFYRENGHCAKKNNCRFLHVQTGSSFFEDESSISMTVAHHEAVLPNVGDTISLKIHVVRTPSCFYISLQSMEGIDGSNMLSKLTEEMRVWYWNETESERNRPFVAGEIVAALYEDERWYRARIIDFDDEPALHTDLRGKSCKVFFVDYGRSTDVAVADIRTIHPDHLYLPFQAIECSLADIGQRSKESWIQAAKVFYEITYGQELRANVRSNEASRLELDLFYKKEDGLWGDVNKRLIELEVAKKTPTLIAPGKMMIIPG